VIDAATRQKVATVKVPGAMLTAEFVTDATGNREVWVFVHPDEGRRSSTLLHMSPEAWERFVGFVATVHRAQPSHAEVLPTDLTHRGAYR
jgi:hypothetical protein